MKSVQLNSKGVSLALAIALIAGCSVTPAQDSNAQEPPVAAEAAIQTAGIETAANIPVAEEIEEARSEFWLASDPLQGAVMRARAPTGATSVLFDGEELPVEADGFFLIGFNRDAPANSTLLATLEDGRKVEKQIDVRPGNWKIEHVNISRSGKGKASEEFARRRAPELEQINAARQQNHESIGWRQDFIWPVKGRISGYFGFQRFYRGEPGGYHTGMDIAGQSANGGRASNQGEPYVAPADGVVILAAHEPFTLEGKLLMIDHGMGLNSAFLHSSELLVNVGDVVKQGQVIGKVGSTGSATGPHLHWGMKWNQARVDPLLLVPAE